MSILALEFPESHADQAIWLERQLVGLDLGQLVEELKALQSSPTDETPTIQEILGDWLDHILAGGLRLLPAEVLRRLLENPLILLQLQELLCERGGRYWERIEAAAPLVRQLVERSRRHLGVALPKEEILRKARPRRQSGPRTERRARPANRKVPPWMRPILMALGLVGAIGLGLGGFFGVRWVVTMAKAPPAIQAWGWNRPEVARFSGSASAYYGHLADTASEWFREKANTPEELTHRLKELRQGCLVMTQAEHPSLSDTERRWLRERLQLSLDPIDQHLARAETQPLPRVREEADLTVGRLIRSLRERGQLVSR